MHRLDLNSGPGQALLAELAARYGEPLARAARLPSHLFLISSTFAPGLSFVGGEIDLGIATSGRTKGSLSLSGTGETMLDALASCVGECVERLSQCEKAGDVRHTGLLGRRASQVMSSARPVIEGLLSDVDQPSREQIAWVVGTLIHTGEEALIPADWCLRRSTTGALAIPGSALSTGCAAGPNFAEAASRALLELIERDAAALWWVGGRRGRPTGLERTAIAEANRSLTVFRQGRRTATLGCLISPLISVFPVWPHYHAVVLGASWLVGWRHDGGSQMRRTPPSWRCVRWNWLAHSWRQSSDKGGKIC